MSFPFATPHYLIDIGGTELDEGITQFVESVEYDSADGMADMAKIVVQNPDLQLQDLKIFQPGNEMSLWLGYDRTLDHVGRTVIRKTNWNFPEDDIPGVVVTGYTLDSVMMDNEPELSKDRRFENLSFSGVVEQVASRYPGLEIDIDELIAKVS